MTAAKKSESTKAKAATKNKQQSQSLKTKKFQISRLKSRISSIKLRVNDLLQRRPHRSFRRTRRRDYVRSLKLPGYIAFTNYVIRMLLSHKRLFIGVVIVYGVLSALFVGLASQQTYTQLSQTLDTAGGEYTTDVWGTLTKAGLLLAAGVTGGLNATQATTDVGVQQVVVTILALLVTWLTTVWLLRAILAGQKPRLRDGIYNSGSPIISTFLVSLMFVVQTLPIAVVIIALVAASSTGLFEGGVEAMVFWIGALLLAALSVYWMTSTFIALIVVTLPGMYPMKALKTAGDLVIGRRIRILLRILWAFIFVAGIWIVTMIPIILLDTWLKGVWPQTVWLPIVPIALLVISSFTIVWTASYIYLLYRRIVEDDAAPA